MKKNNLLLKTNRIYEKWILQCTGISVFLIFSIPVNVNAQSIFVKNNNNCETVINGAVFYENLTTSVLGFDIQSLRNDIKLESDVGIKTNQIKEPKNNLLKVEDERDVELYLKIQDGFEDMDLRNQSYLVSKEHTIYNMGKSI